MKSILKLFGLLLFTCCSAAVLAQPGTKGQVIFLNRLAPLIDAPVLLPDGRGAGYEQGMVAQLFLVDGDLLTPLDPQTTFQQIPHVPLSYGYIHPQDVILPGIPAGVQVTLRFRAWQSTYGSTWEEARNAGGYYGESEVQVVTGGGMNPPTNLFGLQGFVLQRAPYLQAAARTRTLIR
jgi:hypothetical protein